jgi:hypothetical protein
VASEAQPIEVVAGAEVLADLQLVSTRLTTIAGIVVDSAGAPATGGHIMVGAGNSTSGRFMSGGAGNSIKPDGTFTLSGLAPGEYTVIAQATFGESTMFEPFGGRDGQRTASMSVVAGGAPITGLRLVVQEPIRIPVHVTYEDGGAGKPERVYVSANAKRGMGSSMATMRDGRLSLEVVPGTYRISAGSMPMRSADGSAQPWLLKRLAYRGRELEDDEVELTAEPGGRIDIVFTSRSSAVTGGVTDDSGKAVNDYMVIIIPEDAEALRRGSLGRLHVARPDPKGQFRAEHLRPGEYLAAALADAPIEDLHDVDFLESVRRVGKPITIREGTPATLTLKLATLP